MNQQVIIRELIGLRWDDLNFQDNYIEINHNLIYRMQDDGHSEFHITTPKTKAGVRRIPNGVNRAIKKIREAYNEEETEKAIREEREAILLPEFSAHHLRHTFATRFCENETNLKVIQEIMGHSDIAVTMNVYNEATEKKKQESFANLEGKIKIC